MVLGLLSRKSVLQMASRVVNPRYLQQPECYAGTNYKKGVTGWRDQFCVGIEFLLELVLPTKTFWGGEHDILAPTQTYAKTSYVVTRQSVHFNPSCLDKAIGEGKNVCKKSNKCLMEQYYWTTTKQILVIFNDYTIEMKHHYRYFTQNLIDVVYLNYNWIEKTALYWVYKK